MPADVTAGLRPRTIILQAHQQGTQSLPVLLQPIIAVSKLPAGINVVFDPARAAVQKSPKDVYGLPEPGMIVQLPVSYTHLGRYA